MNPSCERGRLERKERTHPCVRFAGILPAWFIFQGDDGRQDAGAPFNQASPLIKTEARDEPSSLARKRKRI